MMKSKAVASLLSTVIFCGAEDGPAVEQPFAPNWKSLSKYECPDWFRDAKFGIYAHWGVYSASLGSSNTDWYGRNMYENGHPNHAEHLKNHGPVDQVGYKDLIPGFTGEKFNADEWVQLYLEAGARFAGPVGEHADGFAMWDSQANPWNAARMGPKRDIVAEMETAVRKRGLKFLVSMHHQWLWGWYPTWNPDTDAGDPANADFYGPKLPPSSRGRRNPDGEFDNMFASPPPSDNFQAKWLEKVKEVVDGYSPDLLWFDNRMEILREDIRAEMAAHFYNHAASTNYQPVLTYKRPDMPLGTATSDLERSRMPDIFPEPWLTDTSISPGSWSYATGMELYSTNRIVDDLVDIVSKNGCMLLNIAPHPDGSIPADQQQTLREIGSWLKLNGTAIYGTRPWLKFGEGPTETPTGHLSDFAFDGFTEKDIRFTTKDNELYAIVLGWPSDGIIHIQSLGSGVYSSPIHSVRMLGHEGTLTFRQESEHLTIEFPSKKTCQHAFVLKIDRQL